MKWFRVPAIWAGLVLASTVSAATLFELKDPSNDDFGWGAVRYPVSMPVRPGELDLIAFNAEQTDEGVWFEARLRAAIHTARGVSGETAGQVDYATRVEFDFHAFNLELYIDKDGVEGSGTLASLPGRQVAFAKDAGWEQVVFVSSRPKLARKQMLEHLNKLAEAQLGQQQLSFEGGDSALRKAVSQQMQQQYFFPDKVKIHNNSLRFFVPHQFLQTRWQPSWRIALLVTSADPEPVAGGGLLSSVSNLMLRPIKTGSGSYSFGGDFQTGSATPQIIDMLLPSVALQQRILSAFDLRLNQAVVLPMLKPDAPELAEAFQTQLKQTQKLGKPDLSLDNQPKITATEAKLPALLKLPDSNKAGPVVSSPKNVDSGESKASALQRLRELKTMQAEGLISEQEFQGLRAQILKSL